jgi:sugar lactone lactonase YvrE
MRNLLLALFFGNLFVFAKAQNIYTIAGTGFPGYTGDGGPSIAAKLNSPGDVKVDALGNIYIVDALNNCIRKIDNFGVINTIAGTGVLGFSGDGGSATLAQFSSPTALALDASGNIYVTDYGNYRIRKINTSGIISTIAGTGVQGYSGDGGPATSAKISNPNAIIVDPLGNIYFSVYCGVRKINTSGIISNFAGNGPCTYGGDGGLATLASMQWPVGLALDASGNMYIAETASCRVRKVDISGVITTFAGNGVQTSAGDGGQAILASLNWPTGVSIDSFGNVYIVDVSRLRKVTPPGIITTISGGAASSCFGTNIPASAAGLGGQFLLSSDNFNNIYYADGYCNKVRVICSSNCPAATSIVDLNENSDLLLIYPNPSNGEVVVTYPNAGVGVHYEIYNSIGQLIKKDEMNVTETKVILNEKPGIYFVKILDGAKMVRVHKIVKG